MVNKWINTHLKKDRIKKDRKKPSHIYIFAIRLKSDNLPVVKYELFGKNTNKLKKSNVLPNPINIIGAVGMVIDKHNDSAEIGYWIEYEHWGKGFATEALQGVIDFGYALKEIQLNKIWAEHSTSNIASGRVMEKVGMKHEGIRRQNLKSGGKYWDMAIKSILREEWYDPN